MMRRLATAGIGFVGLLATFLEIYGIEDPTLRTIAVTISLLIVCGAGLAYLSDELNLTAAPALLRVTNRLGIKKIHETGRATDHQIIKDAKAIRIMVVSGPGLIRAIRECLIYALRHNGACIYVLVADPDSEFINDIERMEEDQAPRIRGETSSVEIELRRCLVEALKGMHPHEIGEIGKILIGYYSTHLRSSLILCDTSWGWLTLNLPPKRAADSVSFELTATPGGLLHDSMTHFNCCWKLLVADGKVRELRPQ